MAVSGLLNLVGAAIGVIVLFALGATALATSSSASSQTSDNVTRPPWAWPVEMLCFVACALLQVRYDSRPEVALANPTDGGERMLGALGVPDSTRGLLFDLDGVLTQTARLHAAAWKRMFDEFLAQRARDTGEPFVAFDSGADYDTYVDGKPRLAGTEAFLASRHIELPAGTAQDPAGTPTVHGLSNKKNYLVLELIRTEGVTVYPGSVRFVHAARDAGLPCAVVTSSANAEQVLTSAELSDLFDARVDGLVAKREGLAGKPAPDTFLAGARLLGVPPEAAVVFEDALAGVAAGRAGHFGYVVGVDRVGQADALREHGADIVVRDLAELLGRT